MEHICRTCLRYSEKLVPLLDATELIYKIEEISSVKVILLLTFRTLCVYLHFTDNIRRKHAFRNL